MNIHLGATEKSLPSTPANRELDRSDTGSERDSNRALTAPNVLMVFPKFNSHSFWNLQEVCDIAGVRCPAPPLGPIKPAIDALNALGMSQTDKRKVFSGNAEKLLKKKLS